MNTRTRTHEHTHTRTHVRTLIIRTNQNIHHMKDRKNEASTRRKITKHTRGGENHHSDGSTHILVDGSIGSDVGEWNKIQFHHHFYYRVSITGKVTLI